MDSNVTSVRIKERLAMKGLSITEAAKLLDMSRQNLTKHLSREHVTNGFLRLFLEKFPLTTKVTEYKSEVNEPLVAYNKERKGISFYNLDVSAGDIDIFNDEHESNERISVPGFNDCKFAFPIYGHSMYPIFESGCIIICKRISDLDIINYGEAYLIITNEQRLLKRVQKGIDDTRILLTSDNNEQGKQGKQKYESFEISKAKIKYLFLVKGSIKRNQI